MGLKWMRFFILFVFPAVISASCHFFEHPDEIDNPIDRCPLNYGYPCPCDATTSKHGAYCDDGSVCLYGIDPARGFCSMPCSDVGIEADCANTSGYGVTGFCWPMENSTSDGQCLVACEYQGEKGSCPPGLACESNALNGFKACLPITQRQADDETVAEQDRCKSFCGQFTTCLDPGLTLEQCITDCIVKDWKSNSCAACWLLCDAAETCDSFNSCISSCPCE